MLRYLIASAVLLVLCGAVFADPQQVAQNPTETPAQIFLATQVAPVNPSAPTPTRTATPLGIALLEAKDFANVRAEPSTDSAQLGTIRSGDKYNVIGRYVSWIQFEFQSSPTGKGWVYGDLVNLTGNIDNIPNIDPYAQTPLDSGAQSAAGTLGAITQTPGGLLTATALARQIAIAPPGAAAATDALPGQPLPTFTYPPGIAAIAPSAGAVTEAGIDAPPRPVAAAAASDTLPPLAPILILGGLGLFGLIVSALRRG